MSTHQHEVASEGRDYGYTGSVTEEDGGAAGNIVRQQTCACGARRSVAINGLHRAEGSWGPSRQQRIDAARERLEHAPVPPPITREDGLRAEVDAAGYVILTGPHRAGDEQSLPASWLGAAKRRRTAIVDLESEVQGAPRGQRACSGRVKHVPLSRCRGKGCRGSETCNHTRERPAR